VVELATLSAAESGLVVVVACPVVDGTGGLAVTDLGATTAASTVDEITDGSRGAVMTC